MNKVPLRIIEIDQHLVDLKRVQVVSPLDKGKFSLTMVSGIDAHCSDASMYESVKQAYRDYMRWEQGLDSPTVTTVNAVGEVMTVKTEVGQVKPECKIVPIEITKEYFSYYIGTWNLASIYKNGLNQFVISFHFNLVSDNSIELLQARYDTMAQADSVVRDILEDYYNRLFT